MDGLTVALYLISVGFKCYVLKLSDTQFLETASELWEM
ncbi:hypothetical protein SCNU_08751 [Gordonia neofelifaecis NRRL B-59395]|uniref:Uncharacterized protein n=1 Tax=Gordonia neofelifaecis NRRL B-59395 TaxID=644548 RepID=F1YIM6_9ACTN|nr:hypothetical protein SCNU_08751 [Gordonia neofelifaecis NRRL B-59395]